MGMSDVDEFIPEERANESPRVFERVGAKVGSCAWRKYSRRLSRPPKRSGAPERER
jgi:hypothetical protein